MITAEGGKLFYFFLGFGQTGPYCDRGGYDVVAAAMFGLMNITGHAVRITFDS
jgi:crotonobetainyl-CoA:carnitine CoA-transferase CaiB-like acyl-CoA transferase